MKTFLFSLRPWLKGAGPMTVTHDSLKGGRATATATLK